MSARRKEIGRLVVVVLKAKSLPDKHTFSKVRNAPRACATKLVLLRWHRPAALTLGSSGRAARPVRRHRALQLVYGDDQGGAQRWAAPRSAPALRSTPLVPAR